jgi:hypothetical protein
MRASASIFLLVLLLSACDVVGPDPFVQEYVVESYQIAGEDIAPVRLTRTAPIDGTFDARELAVRGADVRIHRLDNQGQATESYRLAESRPGVYETGEVGAIEPGARYRLEVDLPDGGQLTSTTFVPGDFQIVQANAAVIRYQGPEQLTLRLTPSTYPGRQSVYLLTSTALDARPETLTPPYRTLYEQGTFTLDELRVGSSPILNEANYSRDEEGLIVIRFPWLGVPFYGFSDVAVNVLDTNLFDFLRTQSVQQGGSTLPPGEIPNVIDNVIGGTGVFGSMARQVYRVQFVP